MRLHPVTHPGIGTPSALARSERALSSFDEYKKEVLSGELDWTPPHKSETFWHENVQLFDEDDFRLVKTLKVLAGSDNQKVASIVQILSHPEKHADLFVMQDLLIDHDENISLWRYHHVLMVERMLGMKRGTGGSEGVGYLLTTLTKKFFPEIWEARTHLKI